MSGVALAMRFEDGPLRAHLARLSQRQEWTKARREMGEYLLADVQDNLDGQKLFDGVAMPQSQAAITRRGKTLIKSHALYDSYVYQLARGGVEVGSNKVYAATHHFGGVTGRKHKTKIMARPVLGIADRQERKIGDYLIAAVKAIEPMGGVA
jgi:phage gpG-like protein